MHGQKPRRKRSRDRQRKTDTQSDRQRKTDPQSDRQTKRETDTHSDRQRERPTHTQTDKERDRHTLRQTDKDTDRHTDRQTKTETDTQTDRHRETAFSQTDIERRIETGWQRNSTWRDSSQTHTQRRIETGWQRNNAWRDSSQETETDGEGQGEYDTAQVRVSRAVPEGDVLTDLPRHCHCPPEQARGVAGAAQTCECWKRRSEKPLLDSPRAFCVTLFDDSAVQLSLPAMSSSQ